MTRRSAITLLRRLFERNGYIRTQRTSRLTEGPTKYKKGDEIRFVVTEEELPDVYEALDVLGIDAGAAFTKGNYMAVPVYGRQVVAELSTLLER